MNAEHSKADARRQRTKERQARWYQANKSRLLAKNKVTLRAWRAANPEKYKAQQARYRAAHRAELNAMNAAWKRTHRAAMNESARRWRMANPEKVKTYMRRAYLKNPARVKRNAVIHNRKLVRTLADAYVRTKLSRNSLIAPQAWPAPVVELKRAQLKLRRLWHSQKT